VTAVAEAPTDVLTSLRALPDVHLPMALVTLDPISHGDGNAGNTQLLRTQEVLSGGRRVKVPYVSGNSVRHGLRNALAWHLVRTLDVPDGSLAKRVVDLLWSGGALTSTGNQAELGMHRRVAQTLLGTSMAGYSAKSDIVSGALYADMVHLLCRENAFRTPPALADHPHAGMPAGAFRGSAFGTRHDVARSAPARFIALGSPEDLGLLDAPPPVVESTQMIHDMQVIKPGAVLWSGLHLSAPTAGHVAALAVALDEAAPEVAGQRIIGLGGKRAQGYGRCSLHVNLAPLGGAGGIATLRTAYEAHLREHRDQILSLLDELTR
jgi:hypothetical protein